jgi:hypothetical protein
MTRTFENDNVMDAIQFMRSMPDIILHMKLFQVIEKRVVAPVLK